MSPLIFNAVIGWAISALDPILGVSLNGSIINCLAYADDIVLLSKTQLGLKSLPDSLVMDLGLGGLNISAGPKGKSASLSITIDGKNKKWLVNQKPFLEVGNQVVPALKANDAYKYLGILITAAGAKQREGSKNELKDGLSNISKAPLKPHQRLNIPRQLLLPKFLHTLVLAPTNTSYLKWFDNMIRSALRSWLKLPKDTPLAFFYANVKAGGLGIPSLRHVIPDLKKNRLN